MPFMQTAPMSLDNVRSIAPSVFADRPYHAVSDKYRFIPTSVVLENMLREGWEVVGAAENRVRIPDKRGFTKHQLTLRHPDSRTLAGMALNDTVPRVVLTNSHDRGSAYTLEAGLFRLACLNGLLVSSGTLGKVSVQHRGGDEIVGNVIEGSFRVVDDLNTIASSVSTLRDIQLDRDEQLAFAKAALSLRWDGDTAPVTADRIIAPRRSADTTNDLWTTYNVVQENIIKGGLRGRNATGHRTTTRKVNSITEDTRINRALWTLADEMAKLKGVALAA